MSAWTELGAGAAARTSRVEAMNSLVLFQDGTALLVDPGVLPGELDEIAARVAAAAPRFEDVAVAFTHPHWDHVLGLPWFPGATTFAHAGFGDELERESAGVAAEAERGLAAFGERLPHPFRPFRPQLAARGTTAVRLGPFEAVSLDTPGHSGTHVSLWFPGPGILAAGDLLSEIEIPWLDAAPWVYRSSLMALHWLYEQEDVRLLVPGHGPVARGRANGYRRLLRDLNYLIQLEQEVAGARQAGLTLEETRAALARMEYVGRDAEHAMNEVHGENVRHAWEALADSTTPGRT